MAIEEIKSQVEGIFTRKWQAIFGYEIEHRLINITFDADYNIGDKIRISAHDWVSFSHGQAVFNCYGELLGWRFIDAGNGTCADFCTENF